MYCNRCGSQNSDGAAFCRGCGAPLRPGAAPDPYAGSGGGTKSRGALMLAILGMVLTAVLAVVLILALRTGPSPDPVSGADGSSDPSGIPSADPFSEEPPTSIPATVIPADPETDGLASVDGPDSTGADPLPPDSVKVFFYEDEREELTLAVGETVKLNAVAYPADRFPNAAFRWSVSDESVIQLTVSGDTGECEVLCLKHQPGSFTLTVECEGVARQVKIYTRPSSPTTAPTTAPRRLTLDRAGQERVNSFLSNFSEQGFGSFDVNTASFDQMIRFVHIYCFLNRQDMITYKNNEALIAVGDVNVQMRRYFGKMIYPNQGDSYDNGAFYYSGSYFHFPPADGEDYNYFTVVDELLDNGDGTYTANFHVYELILFEFRARGISDSYYYLTPDQVDELIEVGNVTLFAAGTATLVDYESPGIVSYQLLRYDTWEA